MQRKLIIGGPGTGKTETLLSIVEEELKQVDSRQVAFSSFTKAAAHGAADRAALKFDLDRKQLQYFATLHANCYRLVGVKRDDMMGRADYTELARLLGVNISASDESWAGGSNGDKMMGLYQYARVTMQEPKEVWNDWGLDLGIGWAEIEQFIGTLERYKHAHHKYDFTDLLERYLEIGSPIPVKVAFVDEYQDLSPLLSAVAEHMFSNAERLYFAGDDRQCIHAWAGADSENLLEFSGSVEVLGKSHRLPRAVFSFADNIAHRIERKVEQHWEPSDREGRVEWETAPQHIDLHTGEWFLLARNTFHLQMWKDVCYDQGVAFTHRDGYSVDPKHVEMIRVWERLRKGKPVPGDRVRSLGYSGLDGVEYHAEDLGLEDMPEWFESLTSIAQATREYYRSILQRGDRLDEPRVHISTIHGVKGREAENVAMLTDMTKRTYNSYLVNPDSEHRVFYVGATRARESLWLITPQTRYYYV